MKKFLKCHCFKLLLTALELFDHVESFCNKVSSVAKKTGLAGRLAPKVTIEKPGFSAEGSWGWKELEKRPECAFSWEIKFGFTPLIGAAVTIDAVPWLLSAWPAFSALVSKSGEDDHFYVAIDVTLEGNISLTFNSEGNSIAPEEGKTEVDLKGKISLELVGRLHVGYKYIGISAFAEGKLGAKATIGGDLEGGQDEEGGFVSGKFFFEGLVGYACWEAGFDVDWFHKHPLETKELKTDNKVEGGSKDDDGCLLVGTQEWPLFKRRFANSE